MKTITAIFLLLLSNCSVFYITEFKHFTSDINTTALAEKQDSLIQVYNNKQIVSDSTINELKNNKWVKVASIIAPNNLIIRQYCLIDLFDCAPAHTEYIINACNILMYKQNEQCLWAEGYSYWLYTRDLLVLFKNEFKDDSLAKIITDIDRGFNATAYNRNAVWYPAPYGDLRDQPLINYEPSQQDYTNYSIISITRKDETIYDINSYPIGLNSHVPVGRSIVTIKNGIPLDFKFYNGFDKKYANKEEELKDTFDPRRISSIKKLKLIELLKHE
jgi:hypothetical protein